jgi:hypothetical protein
MRGPLRCPHLERDHMNEGWERAKRVREILGACGIEVGTDFQALGTSQVIALLGYADQHRLNKYGPMSAEAANQKWLAAAKFP